MDELTLIRTFGRLPAWAATDDELSAGASGGRLLATVALNRARGVVTGLDDDLAAIDADKMLSPDGKRHQKARKVADAESRLARIVAHREKLAAEIAAAQAAWKPTEPDSVTVAAIWPGVPDNTMNAAMLYRQAIAAGDWRTMGAIESLPVTHAGRLPPDEMAALRRERRMAEVPELDAKIMQAVEYADAVDSALNSARQYVEDTGRGLPAPDAESAFAGTDENGLRILSPSGFDQAMGEI